MDYFAPLAMTELELVFDISAELVVYSLENDFLVYSL